MISASMSVLPSRSWNVCRRAQSDMCTHISHLTFFPSLFSPSFPRFQGNDINLNSEGKDPFAEAKKLGMFRSIERVDFISSTDIINRLLKATNKDLRVQRRTEEEDDADSFLLTTDRLCQFMNTTRHQPHKPREGQRVIYVCGSWDLFHSGHVRLLQEAKKLGDFLLVGIHEDTSVQTHCGPGQNQCKYRSHERANAVRAEAHNGCRCCFVCSLFCDVLCSPSSL